MSADKTTKAEIHRLSVGLRSLIQAMRYNLELGDVRKAVDLADKISTMGNALDVAVTSYYYEV